MSIEVKYIIRINAALNIELNTILDVMNGVNIEELFFLTFLFIISLSFFSKDNAIAGSESVTKFIYNKCIGKNILYPNNTDVNTIIISAILAVIKYVIAFLIFSYIFLPSSTDTTIVEKLSSTKIISATFLVTSVPVIPMPTPTSDTFKAGASFTPSPVIATTLLFAFQAFTILSLCSGVTLA